MISKIRSLIRKLHRTFNKPAWHNIRTIQPISRVFGLDRGTPIDRYYIEQFLRRHSNLIQGRVLEISENTYTRKFGTIVTSSEILHYDRSNSRATIIGDLTKPASLPISCIDCFICTQTLNFIFNVKNAVQGIYQLLSPNGVALITVAGISQISRYDMDRWGDYWRFTTRSASQLFTEVFGEQQVKVESRGNVLSSVAFLEGIVSEELTKEELEYQDEDYQMLVTVVATKKDSQ